MPDIFDKIAPSETGDIFDKLESDTETEITKDAPIGFWESMLQDIEEKLPFSPAAALKAADVMYAAHRLSKNKYPTHPVKVLLPGTTTLATMFSDPEAMALISTTPETAPEDLRQADIKLIETFLETMAEREQRGYTLGGKVGSIVSALPAFVVEFIATGGLQALTSKTAKEFGKRILKKHAKTRLGKIALETAGFAAGTAARAYAGMPHRTAQSILERRLPRNLTITEDGEAIPTGPQESLFTSMWKGLADQYIEIASEQAGQAVIPMGKLLKRLPFTGKFINQLQKLWLKKFPDFSAADFLQRIGTRTGFHGVLAEVGEEDVGWITRAILNVDDFGAGSDSTIGQRLAMGWEQDKSNLPAELIAFSIPGVVRAGAIGAAATIEEATPIQGYRITYPSETYDTAVSTPRGAEEGGMNVWIRKDQKVKSNEDRHLLMQFSSPLLTEDEESDAKEYYDKLYKTRKGYDRLNDFWEIPAWIGQVANTVPNSDTYVIRNVDEAIDFLNQSGYKKVFFSSLNVNKDFIRRIAQNFKGDVIVGGYAPKEYFKDIKNIRTYDSIQDMAKAEGYDFKEGVDLSYFKGSKVISRLCMSKGCLHKCAFCTVPKGITKISDAFIDKQVDAIGELDSQYIYLDDKTFGQSENYKKLIDINKKLKAKNPNFKGFIIQTTATQMKKFTDEFLQESGIKYVELGVETYNDPILKKLHKPARERSIDEAVEKLRRNNIAFIPNIIIGIPGENADTYARTLDFLNRNSDIISHINAYNLALYEGTELGDILESKTSLDTNENAVAKSFHDNPQDHIAFAKAIYELGNKLLDKPSIVETIDRAIEEGEVKAGKPANLSEREPYKLAKGEKPISNTEKKQLEEKGYTVPEIARLSPNEARRILGLPAIKKRLTRKQQLAIGHLLPKLLGLSEEERRKTMIAITGKSSMKNMTPAQREQVINEFKKLADEAGIDTKNLSDVTPYDELMLKLQERKEKPALTTRDRRTLTKSRQLWHSIKSGLTSYVMGMSRIKRICRALDNYEDSGPFSTYIYERVKRADTEAAVGLTAVLESSRNTFAKYGIDVHTMMTEVKDIGIKDKLTTSQRIGIWALAQNKNTYRHLRSEFTEEEIEKIVNSVEMDEKEVFAGNEVKAYFEIEWPVFKAIAESVGIKGLIKEQNYITALVVADKDELEEVAFVNELTAKFEGKARVPGEERAIKRRPGASKNLELDIFNIYARGVQSVERFKHMAPIADEVGRTLNNRLFKAALNNATYGHGAKLFNTWMKDAVKGRTYAATDSISKALRWLRYSSIHFVLGFKILTAAKQGISLLPAMSKDSRMVPAVMYNLMNNSYGKNYKNIEKEVQKKSILVRTRDWNRDLRQIWNNKTIRKFFANKQLSPLSMRMAQSIDRHTVTLVWWSAYQVAQDKGKNEQDSIKYADGIVEDTQPMGKSVDLPHFFRGGELAKNLTAFQNQVNQNGNIFWYDILGEYKARKINNTELAYRLLMSQVLPALLLGMVSRGRPPDDPIEITKDLAFYLMSPYMFIGRLTYNLITGDWGPEQGFLFETPAREAGYAASALRRGDIKNATKYGARTVGALTKGLIPLQAIQVTEGLIDLASGETDDVRRLLWSERALEKDKEMEERKGLW